MPCRFASSGTVATSRSASRAILALNVASNFLRDLVISVLHRLRQSRTLHTLTFGPISGVHFIVAGFGLGGPRTAIERLYPHPPHQRLHMPAADLAPLGSQQASQHTRTGEGELKVQPIQMPHDREVGRRHRARQIINAAAADLQNVRLLGDRQIVLAVDHRFALSNPALVSAPSKKSFSSVSSPILACSDFTSITGVAGVALPGPKTPEAPPSSC